MSQLILLRHGQSMWNLANRFTGWVDVPLSKPGIEEAVHAGECLADTAIDMVFLSTLQRAQQTAMIALAQQTGDRIPVVLHDDPDLQAKAGIFAEDAKRQMIPCYIDARLNERYYGELQGMDKDQMRQQYGAEQVHIWRRSFDVPPPSGESLQMTAARTLPCLHERIIPALAQVDCVLVAAHGNSLRSIVMDIERLSPDEVLKLEIPTGVPRIYTFIDEKWELRV